MNTYLQFFLSLLIGIIGASITSFVNYKNVKSPNKEKIATELLENFFAPHSPKLELMLYHNLTPTVKQELIKVQKKNKKQLIYFSSDFNIDLRMITEHNDDDLESAQNLFDSFSMIYLRTLNQTRTTLGLPKISVQFRIRNGLFKNPKSAKRLFTLQKYLILIFLLSAILLMSAFILDAGPLTNIPFLPFIIVILFMFLIISALFLYLLNEFFKY